MPGKRFTDEEKDTMVVLYAALGGNAREVARRLGCSPPTVISAVKEARAQSKDFALESNGLVLDELKGKMIATSNTIIDSIDEAVIQRASGPQRALMVGILTDKALKIAEMEQKQTAETPLALPAASDIAGMRVLIMERITSMPWLQNNPQTQAVVEHAQRVVESAPSAHVVEPALDLDGNNVAAFLPPMPNLDG